MRVRSPLSILISLLLLIVSCTGASNSDGEFSGSRCFVTVETGRGISCSYMEKFTMNDAEIISDTIHLLHVHCLDGGTFTHVDSLSSYADYLRACVAGERVSGGEFPSIKSDFYRKVADVKGREDVLQLSDMLERKSYCHRFHFYYPDGVNFYRNVLRFEIAYFKYREGDINSSLRILYSLEKSKDSRIVWLARKLKNRIYAQLQQPPDTSPIPFPISGDSVIVHSILCEMDFPETLVVRGGRLHVWISPFSRRFLGDSLSLNEIGG